MIFRTISTYIFCLLLSTTLFACGADSVGPASDAVDSDTALDAQSPDSTGDSVQDFVQDWPSTDLAVQPEDIPEPEAVVVTSLLPNRGKIKGGQTVSIVGEGFSQDVEVYFDGLPAPWVVYVEPTRLHVQTPAHPPGLVRVTVVCDGARLGSLEQAFLYYNDLSVASISPALGPTTGGTPITVTGTGFRPDSTLILGQSKTLETVVLSDEVIIAISPQGSAGPAEVVVSNELGVSTLYNGFHYTQTPTIEYVMPAGGPSAGGQELTLRGTGLTTAHTAYFDTSQASDLQVIDDETVVVTTPAHPAGTSHIRVDTAEGVAVLHDAYTFHDGSDAPTDTAFINPISGPTAGGTKVIVTTPFSDLDGETQVLFADQGATIVSMDPELKTIVVESPAAENPGPVNVTVLHGTSSASATSSFTYLVTPQITAVVPAFGPQGGGTTALIQGVDLPQQAEVYVGALKALEVTWNNAQELEIITPPGSPGLADVRIVSQDGIQILEGGFTYTTEQTELYVVHPEAGSIAGGTYVHVIGAGFDEDSTVWFGTSPAVDVTYISPTFLTARTPAGETGPVDVQVISGDSTANLNQGYSYFDPKNTFGGTWGGPVDVAINISVLDGATAQPLEDAYVFLDNDPLTLYQGYTNENGQVTFSGPDLDGAHTISVSKEGFVTYSVVHFDAENVTVFLEPLVLDMGSGLLDGIMPPWVEGNVFGLDKYVVVPPGPCVNNGASDPLHCAECDDDEDCGALGGTCFDLGGDDGRRCLMQCSSDEDCPSKSACKSFGAIDHCVPTAGIKVAICTGTKPSYNYFEVPLGPLAKVNAQDSYGVIVFPGIINIVCFGGFWTADDPPNSSDLEKEIKGNPSGNFIPVTMGVAKDIVATPGEITTSVDIDLDIPLNRNLEARMENPPFDDIDYARLRTFLDFGSNGVVRMPTNDMVFGDAVFNVDHLPKQLTDDLEDASYTFFVLGYAYQDVNGYSYPRTYHVRQGIEEPQDDRMLNRVSGSWQAVPTGVQYNIQAAKDFASDWIFTVGDEGSVYLFNGDQYYLQSSGTFRRMRAIDGDHKEDVWAVGDSGKVLHFNGLGWTEQETGLTQNLRAVFAPGDGSLWIAGQYASAYRDGDGVWTTGAAPVGAWNGMHGTGPEDLWLVGNQGNIWHYNGTFWSNITSPTSINLRSVHAIAPDDVWFSGEAGVLLHYDGTEITASVSNTTRSLNALSARASDEVYAVGNHGTVLIWDGSIWSPIPEVDYSQDLRAVVTPTETSDVHTFGDHNLLLGPILAPAWFDSPLNNGPLVNQEIAWTADNSVEPNFQEIAIQVPGLMGWYSIWTMIADGLTTMAPVPDFPNLEGTPGIGQGEHRVILTRVYQEGFDIDNFDYTQLGTIDRQSWAISLRPFLPEEVAP